MEAGTMTRMRPAGGQQAGRLAGGGGRARERTSGEGGEGGRIVRVKPRGDVTRRRMRDGEGCVDRIASSVSRVVRERKRKKERER